MPYSLNPVLTGNLVSLLPIRAEDGPRLLEKQHTRLGSHQSALAFQYAKVLENAISVFGSQKLAEEWLGRPCKYLEVDAPLDIIDNALGYQIVQDYLNRIGYGVYQ